MLSAFLLTSAAASIAQPIVRNLIPNLDFQMWENVSHFLMMEKPREFNAAVLKFLEQNHLLQS